MRTADGDKVDWGQIATHAAIQVVMARFGGKVGARVGGALVTRFGPRAASLVTPLIMHGANTVFASVIDDAILALRGKPITMKQFEAELVARLLDPKSIAFAIIQSRLETSLAGERQGAPPVATAKVEPGPPTPPAWATAKPSPKPQAEPAAKPSPTPQAQPAAKPPATPQAQPATKPPAAPQAQPATRPPAGTARRFPYSGHGAALIRASSIRPQSWRPPRAQRTSPPPTRGGRWACGEAGRALPAG